MLHKGIVGWAKARLSCVDACAHRVHAPCPRGEIRVRAILRTLLVFELLDLDVEAVAEMAAVAVA
jgi:hypothetical protein